jgi:hypothetical protein
MPVEQISPDKDLNFRYTTVAFSLSPEPGASLFCANLPGDWALYAISVPRIKSGAGLAYRFAVMARNFNLTTRTLWRTLKICKFFRFEVSHANSDSN